MSHTVDDHFTITFRYYPAGYSRTTSPPAQNQYNCCSCHSIMLQEHISLYMVSSCGRYVVFTVTEPSRDVYCSDEAPFLYITQFRW